MAAHHASVRNDSGRRLWDTREAALSFWNMSQENNAERIRKTIAGLPLTPDSQVLDIGAGPGTLAVPIAGRVRHVTAVEPSAGMYEVLTEKAAEAGAENLDSVRKSWEEVEVEKDLSGPYDLVFASFSLVVPDIEEAVRKMNEASSKYVCIYWFAGKTSWEYHMRRLWPALHGREFVPEPGSDIIFQLLYNAGIFPDIRNFTYRHINRFSSLDEAVRHFSPQYEITSDRQREILREYLSKQIQKDGEGLIITGWSARMKISWDVTEQNQE